MQRHRGQPAEEDRPLGAGGAARPGRRVGDAEPGHRGEDRVQQRRDHAPEHEGVAEQGDAAAFRGHDRVDVIADVLDHGEAEADHGGVDHPVGRPVDLVAPPPQQAEQHQALHRLLDHRRAERRRHVLAGARAERGHRHVLEVGGVDDQRGQRRDPRAPDEREREVLPRLGLEPVHPQHQRDQQRHRQQRQRQRDRERRRAVAEREGLHRVDPDGDERAGGGDRHADDEADRGTSRVAVREHRRRIERPGRLGGSAGSAGSGASWGSDAPDGTEASGGSDICGSILRMPAALRCAFNGHDWSRPFARFGLDQRYGEPCGNGLPRHVSRKRGGIGSMAWHGGHGGLRPARLPPRTYRRNRRTSEEVSRREP